LALSSPVLVRGSERRARERNESRLIYRATGREFALRRIPVHDLFDLLRVQAKVGSNTAVVRWIAVQHLNDLSNGPRLLNREIEILRFTEAPAPSANLLEQICVLVLIDGPGRPGAIADTRLGRPLCITRWPSS
jgi:hypothetical protein